MVHILDASVNTVAKKTEGRGRGVIRVKGQGEKESRIERQKELKPRKRGKQRRGGNRRRARAKMRGSPVGPTVILLQAQKAPT